MKAILSNLNFSKSIYPSRVLKHKTGTASKSQWVHRDAHWSMRVLFWLREIVDTCQHPQPLELREALLLSRGSSDTNRGCSCPSMTSAGFRLLSMWLLFPTPIKKIWNWIILYNPQASQCLITILKTSLPGCCFFKNHFLKATECSF